jgi:hypothetical protein
MGKPFQIRQKRKEGGWCVVISCAGWQWMKFGQSPDALEAWEAEARKILRQNKMSVPLAFAAAPQLGGYSYDMRPYIRKRTAKQQADRAAKQ